MADRLHLQPKHRRVLEALLRKHLPGVEVWAYGSRVSGRSHDGSDLDLVLRGPGLSGDSGRSTGGFRRSGARVACSLLVEARDWSRLPERFHREIERDHVVLAEKSERGTGRRLADGASRQVTELTLSSVDKKAKPCEHAVLLCNYMDVYSNRFIRSDLDFMTATANEREIQRCTLRPEDVVITKDSEQYDDIGVPALVRDDIDNLVCGYHLAILRPLRESIRGSYLLYALQIGMSNISFTHTQTASRDSRYGRTTSCVLKFPFLRSPTEHHRPHPRYVGRQNRDQSAYERDAGGDGPRPVQVVVRRFRPRPRQDGGPATPVCPNPSPTSSPTASSTPRSARSRRVGTQLP